MTEQATTTAPAGVTTTPNTASDTAATGTQPGAQTAPPTQAEKREIAKIKAMLGGSEIEVSEEEIRELAKKIKHKTKINGKEQEHDYDRLVQLAQLYPAADEKFQQASQKDQEVRKATAEIQQFQQNPWEYAMARGMDPYAMAEQLLLQKLEWESMSQEQKDLEKERIRSARLEEELNKRTASEKQEKLRLAESQAGQEIDQEIGAALKSLGKRPTPRLIAETALAMLAHHEAGGKLAASDAVAMSNRNIDAAVQERLESLTVEEARKVLPAALLDGLRKADVERVMAQDPLRSRRAATSPESKPRQAKITSSDEYFERLEKRFT